MKLYGLEGKKVFLTGASGGIGTAIRERYEQAGCVVIAPKHDELELTSENSIRKNAENNSDVDIFVHCAGLNILAGIEEINTEILHSVFDVNVHSAITLLQSFVKHMKEKRWGRIVFVSSLYGIISRERRIAYSTSKTALSGLAKTLTLELAQDNILSNCVAPGYVMTEMTRKNLSEKEIQDIEDRIPTRRFQFPYEIADLVVFLCSDLNRSISGQFIAVDGGFTCH